MAEKPFRVAFESKLGAPVPAQWEKWGRCVSELRPITPIDSYRVIQPQTGAPFLLLKFKGSGPATQNCHSYASRFLQSFAEVSDTFGGVLGFPVCGSNPQQSILDTSTQLILDKLPQEPMALDKALDKASPRAGDILVWIDRNAGTLVHSTTMIGRVDGGWLLNDKMNDRAARKTWVTVVAQELYRPETPSYGDEEFHPERLPTQYEVQLRRPK